MGDDSSISGSESQKVTARSSTESELYGVDGTISYIEWSGLFYKCQFKYYPIEHPLKELGKNNLLLQDNTSTIKMLKGGRRTCGKRTRNINIKYFYATERIGDGTIQVSYCPTKEMTSDFLSKPLQGSLFRTHRNAYWCSGVSNFVTSF